VSQTVSRVVRPASLDEVASIFVEAGRTGTAITIGEELDPTGLDRILEHEAGDLTCTVEAGVRLSALRTALAPSGQRLALDPPGDPTVGACVAAALSGPLRHRFGTPRDLVLGVTLVLGDGTVTSSGGKVVKNVAGYDLGKLMCGSRGSLALIGRVSLRLHPIPEAAVTHVVDTDDVAGVASQLLASQLSPSALDVLHPGRVCVLFEGAAAAVESQLESARALVGGSPRSASVWDEARERQAAALGRLRFAPRDVRSVLSTVRTAVVRPAAGVAYVPHRVGGVPGTVERRLQRALKAQFDPHGVLR
jgi:glycolate oxidase FAD binding subunit